MPRTVPTFAKHVLMLLLPGILLAASHQEESCVAPACNGEEASRDGLMLLQHHVRKTGEAAGLDEEALLKRICKAAGASNKPRCDPLRDLFHIEAKVSSVAFGLKQMLDSVLMKPKLPSAAQVAAACPAGKDCTRSVVVDSSVNFLEQFGFMKEHGVSPTTGVCYNAPYYYVEDCIASGVSPNAGAAMVNPVVVKGTTCEEQGYAPWLAYYADPFYGWANNVSLFVEKGLVDWVPVAADLLTCKKCVESLTIGGWGYDWKRKNPECK